MKKIFNYLNRIPKDKWMHFCAGFAIAPWPYLLFNLIIGFWAGILASIITVVVAAKAKEIYDSKHGGLFDWMDFFATVAGGTFFWLVFVIAHLIGK